jgi:hypothetical protein
MRTFLSFAIRFRSRSEGIVNLAGIAEIMVQNLGKSGGSAHIF